MAEQANCPRCGVDIRPSHMIPWRDEGDFCKKCIVELAQRAVLECQDVHNKSWDMDAVKMIERLGRGRSSLCFHADSAERYSTSRPLNNGQMNKQLTKNWWRGLEL